MVVKLVVKFSLTFSLSGLSLKYPCLENDKCSESDLEKTNARLLLNLNHFRDSVASHFGV